MKIQNTRPIQQNIFVIYILLLLSLIGSIGWLNWLDIRNPASTETTTTPTPVQVNKALISKENNTVPKPTIPFTIPQQTEKLTPKENTAAVQQLQPKAYLLQVKGEKVSLVPQPVAIKEGTSKEVALQQTLNQLFARNQNNQFTSTIPQGTKLLGLQIDETGIHINLSDEFRYGGGSTSMIYRVAQVLYTASSLDSEANIYLSVEGKLLNEENPLGGEGLILAEPLTRQTFVKDFSIN
ncbi:GerMN domain-containing protein [Rivularia sp. UHCC 0363]|uniref:GerMN domain-containing protein n=1 Tax=Rivularia sp. UHCC 0363 TaxID=3110244 RepID=UPI002B1FABCB|nr:GerMN domain-containing protein [Rivularia sp. UHCC 0363]MEA5594056.1 GerMN domain-containing protein [Rivularia sp. UHCC 0363]